MDIRQAAAADRQPAWPTVLLMGGNAPFKEHVMTQSNILGLVALAIGTLLLFFAWRASTAPVDQVTEALTGRFTGNTMWYLIGGVGAAAAGIGLLALGYIRS